MNFGSNRQLAAVSIAFRASGLIVGLPALIFAIFDGLNAYDMFAAQPGDDPLSHDTNGLIGFVIDEATSLDSKLHLLAQSAAWLFTTLAIAAVLIVFLSFFVFLIGGAIGRRATWGRVLGIAASALVAGAGGTAIAYVAAQPLLDQSLAFWSALPCAGGLYALWVLFRRFD